MLFLAVNPFREFANFFDTVINYIRDGWSYLSNTISDMKLILDYLPDFKLVLSSVTNTLWMPIAVSFGAVVVLSIVKFIIGRMST